VRQKFLQRIYIIAIHGTLGSHLRDALQGGGADTVACLSVPRAKAFGNFPSFFLFALRFPLLFHVRILVY
jgi:nucleoside-diphosphate-sugar epimerase